MKENKTKSVAENANMKLWNAVCTTDPKHTKNANVRGHKITSIAPQYQIMQATEQMGPYGGRWGFERIEFDYTLVGVNGLVILLGIFYYPDGKFPITASISAWRDNAMTKPDIDFAKKVETDALTKALSKLGFAADVFMGSYDDVKYMNQLREDFSDKISAVQVKILIELITETEADLAGFLKYIGVKSVDCIPTEKYETAYGVLKAKQKRMEDLKASAEKEIKNGS